jgi:uncharacterized protein
MTYRKLIKSKDLIVQEIKLEESNILVYSEKPVKQLAKKYLKEARDQIISFIKQHPEFETSFQPLEADKKAGRLVKTIFKASKSAGVGPMASIAGAIAEYVGNKLLSSSTEIIVENGGDIFLKSSKERVIGVFAGKSPLSQKIGIKIPPSSKSCGICTSSGTVGHSFSYGIADAVVIISSSCPYADAWATKIANLIKKDSDIKKVLKIIRKNKRLSGALIIKGSKLAVTGKVIVKNI